MGCPPDGPHLAHLQYAQEVRLQRERDLRHLVEHQRAAARGPEEALLLGDRAGEGPAHLPEEVAREQPLGEGPAVDREERPRTAAALVEQAADILLAGARLAGDHHRVLAHGDPLDAAPHPRHHRALPDQPYLGGRPIRQSARGGEHDERVTQPDDVAGLERLLSDERSPVEPGPARAAEIAQQHAARLEAHLGVPRRHLLVGERRTEDLRTAPELKPVARDAAPLHRAAVCSEACERQRRLGNICLRRLQGRLACFINHVRTPMSWNNEFSSSLGAHERNQYPR